MSTEAREDIQLGGKGHVPVPFLLVKEEVNVPRTTTPLHFLNPAISSTKPLSSCHALCEATFPYSTPALK